jgi:hypothetical protein
MLKNCINKLLNLKGGKVKNIIYRLQVIVMSDAWHGSKSPNTTFHRSNLTR